MGIQQGSFLAEMELVEDDPCCFADRHRDQVEQVVVLVLVLADLVLELVLPDRKCSSQPPFAVAAEACIHQGE